MATEIEIDSTAPPRRPRLAPLANGVWNAIKAVGRLFGTSLVLGLSLLPLSALLLAIPAVAPQESVLSDAVPGRMSPGRRLLRRLFAVVTSLTVLITILAASVELTSRLPLPEKGHFAIVAETVLPAPIAILKKPDMTKDAFLEGKSPTAVAFLTTPLADRLPPVMVQHWPLVILVMYAIDLLLVLLLGKVPLSYNLRNVRVRWKTNLLTSLAFMFVVGLMVFLMAFVTGMNNLTENTGVPSNVFALSDGATDELFSNLGYGDLDNVERAVARLDAKDRPLAEPIKIASVMRDGRKVYLASRETYYVLNQPIANSDPPRRRLVQLRTIEDPLVAEAVHKVSLYPGGKWFGDSGVDQESRIECVLGEGVAGTLGADVGKTSLVAGDTFILGDVEWIVRGVMKSQGTTFGSEVWAKRFSRIYGPFGKQSYTTLVLRAEPETLAAAQAMAYHLNNRYTQQKLKTYAEPDYYAELTKTNNTFLACVVVVAFVMAIGGVFGMMTTMFASINQRIRDIGVLRLLGFKRWQVMVSFLIESLAIAMIGGVFGCLLARTVNGRTSTSTLSSGGGGPGGKSVAVTLDVDWQVVVLGLLFTLVLGRLGGLVPALSATRMKILDSLR